MSKSLSVFDQPPPPSAIDDDELFGGSNIEDRVTVPSVGVTGKVWSFSYNGEKFTPTKLNEDGEEELLSVLRVVILKHPKERGRSYYSGDYSPENTSAPVCWSDDGKTPNAASSEPQATSCAQCPMAVKGSKISGQGKEVAACSEYRMIAVVPADNLGSVPPLRLKLAPTSDYDARSPELAAQNWFAFRQYKEWLRQRGVTHTGRIVTKMKFDPSAAYPKILFSGDRWLSDDEKIISAKLARSPEAEAIVSGAWSPAGVDGKPVTPINQLAPKPAPKQIAKAPVIEDDEDDVVEAPKPAKAPAKKADSRSEAPTAAAPKKKAQVVEIAPDELADILNDFGDD
jgi:hypothetical protein